MNPQKLYYILSCSGLQRHDGWSDGGVEKEVIQYPIDVGTLPGGSSTIQRHYRTLPHPTTHHLLHSPHVVGESEPILRDLLKHLIEGIKAALHPIHRIGPVRPEIIEEVLLPACHQIITGVFEVFPHP